MNSPFRTPFPHGSASVPADADHSEAFPPGRVRAAGPPPDRLLIETRVSRCDNAGERYPRPRLGSIEIALVAPGRYRILRRLGPEVTAYLAAEAGADIRHGCALETAGTNIADLLEAAAEP